MEPTDQFFPLHKRTEAPAVFMINQDFPQTGRIGCQMLTHLPLNVNPQAGTGSPAGSPYHVGIRDATKNQRHGVVKNPFL